MSMQIVIHIAKPAFFASWETLPNPDFFNGQYKRRIQPDGQLHICSNVP